jgi:hypothetical protein
VGEPETGRLQNNNTFFTEYLAHFSPKEETKTKIGIKKAT